MRSGKPGMGRRARGAGVVVVLVLLMGTPTLFVANPTSAYLQAGNNDPVPWNVDVVFQAYPSIAASWAAARNASVVYEVPTYKLAGFRSDDYGLDWKLMVSVPRAA